MLLIERVFKDVIFLSIKPSLYLVVSFKCRQAVLSLVVGPEKQSTKFCTQTGQSWVKNEERKKERKVKLLLWWHLRCFSGCDFTLFAEQ